MSGEGFFGDEGKFPVESGTGRFFRRGLWGRERMGRGVDCGCDTTVRIRTGGDLSERPSPHRWTTGFFD